MYAGKPVEVGGVEDIFYRPRMPYTLGSRAAPPGSTDPPSGWTPIPIPAVGGRDAAGLPVHAALPAGHRDLRPVRAGARRGRRRHRAACHHSSVDGCGAAGRVRCGPARGEAEDQAAVGAGGHPVSHPANTATTTALLSARNLVKTFRSAPAACCAATSAPSRRSATSRSTSPRARPGPGRRVRGSRRWPGSRSTPSWRPGEVRFATSGSPGLSARMRSLRWQMQLVFQDPYVTDPVDAR
ncbi:hypothetical protein HBB16_20580 [Pseudonocardia sp. MCCB 268]|nr:hypothetical protein [Pseudonocardia cytotoxica]